MTVELGRSHRPSKLHSSETNSQGHEECVARELVRAVRSLAGKQPGLGCGRAAGDGSRRAIAKLIGHIKVETVAFVANANTEKMAVQVRGQRRIIGVGHGV